MTGPAQPCGDDLLYNTGFTPQPPSTASSAPVINPAAPEQGSVLAPDRNVRGAGIEHPCDRLVVGGGDLRTEVILEHQRSIDHRVPAAALEWQVRVPPLGHLFTF
jgi:hypothetical protein